MPPPTSPPVAPPPSDPKRGARLHEAQRWQMVWGRIDLDAQLPEDHPARAIWAVVERLDLSMLYGQIEARDEVAGAPAIDPKILLALWVYATSEGEGSAREIWRLTELHVAYRWICGGAQARGAAADRAAGGGAPAGARGDRDEEAQRRQGCHGAGFDDRP